jgi:sulfatase maturation enzyme AslB (radical SAM superfamily)
MFEFSGGEPTLCYEIDQIIDYIKEMGQNYNIEPKFSVVSNGYFLDELITRCPDITEVLISLHGDRHTHNQITKNLIAKGIKINKINIGTEVEISDVEE